MPELPEVETTRRGIAPHLTGRIIRHVQVREHRLRWPVSTDLPSLIEGRKVLDVKRRGKYLLLRFAHGHLLIHLGMSGSLRLEKADVAALKHDHVIFVLPRNMTLRFNDPRRFGCILWTADEPENHPLLSKLGPEPLGKSFDGDYLFEQSRGRKVAVKNFIMDSHVVVGVGNIYANEALFASGIRPRTAAHRVSRQRYAALAKNIQRVLADAISMGGTTLRDFVGGDGKPGYFQQTLNVYGRAGEPCRICQTPIRHIVVGQRSTYYCPTCQH